MANLPRGGGFWRGEVEAGRWDGALTWEGQGQLLFVPAERAGSGNMPVPGPGGIWGEVEGKVPCQGDFLQGPTKNYNAVLFIRDRKSVV